MSAPPGEKHDRYTSARRIVAQMWDGPLTVRRIGLTHDEQVAACASLDDKTISASLVGLGVDPLPSTPQARLARLQGWPSDQDLQAIATGLVAQNDGVRPVVRDEAATFRFTGLPS